MNFIKKNKFIFLVLGILLFLYRNWFSRGLLSAPDFPFMYSSQLGAFTWWPYAWSNIFGYGLGAPTFNTLNLNTYLQIAAKFLVFILHVPWNVTYRLLFFWPFIVIGIISSFYFCQSITKNKNLASLGALIYMSNTYVLMLAGGGQVGLMMAYAFAPLVFGAFINQRSFLLTFSTTMLMLFDLRFSFLIVVCIFLYVILVIPAKKWISIAWFSFFPGIIVLCVHSFWLIPLFLSHSVMLPEGFDSPKWFSYLSWAQFSGSLSLLHPNWPENIFGKIYFMRPEFILLPILAFSSLLFINGLTNSRVKKFVSFFALLGLIGTFLAKGANPPFEFVNQWFFVHAPFFNGFRDPTKFYLVTALSYAVLIPFSLKLLTDWFHRKLPKVKVFQTTNWVLLLFLFYWLLLLIPLFTGKVGGTFRKITIPSEYAKFENLVVSQTGFGRTLVVPWRNRFVFQSENNPPLDSRDVFQTTDLQKILAALKAQNAQAILKALAVRYVVVPDDFTNEIFLSNRMYDPALKQNVVRVLDSLPFLNKITGFGGLEVYEFTQFSGLFYTVLPNGGISPYSANKIDPVTYTINVNVLYRPAKVIFSQKYDPNWVLWDGGKIITSQKTSDGMNSFILDSLITNQATVYYKNQRILNIGVYISLSVILILFAILYFKIAKRLKLGKKFHLTILLLIFSIIFFLRPKDNNKNIINNQNIWWSKEWKELKNPFVKGEMILSGYGGDEIRFNVENSKSLSLKVTSSNNYDDTQGIDVYVDGKIYKLATPNINKKELKISFANYDKTKKYSIRIRHYCGGSFSACDLALREIDVEQKAIISQPVTVPTKTLAMLGDSISVSFSDLNFTYLLADKLGYQLHNAGIFGMTASYLPGWETGAKPYYWESGVKQYYDDIVRYKPDVVLVFLGTNDTPESSEIFRTNYAKLIEGIKQGTPTSTIISIGLLRRKEYNAKILEFNNIIQEVAIQNNVPFLNAYDWLDESDFQDEVHPSPASQPKLFEKFYENLLSVLQK